jgi:CHAT domain-containing protein/tetratricopeptide (TPR) repeat protein
VNERFWLPASAALLLSACSQQPAVPNGTQVLDEEVTLTRQTEKYVDTASREIAVADDSILIAIVDEQLTNVKLTLAVVDDENGDEKGAPKPVEVENNLWGAGVELASIDAPEGSRVRVTLTSAQDAVQPGKVHLRVRQYAASAAKNSKFKTQLAAFRAWTAATNATYRAEEAKKEGLPAIQRAIDALESENGDAVFAANARLIKARMLYIFRVDWREAHDESRRAAASFAHLPKPDALYEARARFVEALALAEMSDDRELKNPTSEEALRLSRETLEQLSASTSALGPIERARVIGELGELDVKSMQADAANKHFEEARAIFESQSYVAGDREMRWNLGLVLVEQGRFAEAATALMALAPQMDQITNPELRVKAYLAVGRALSFSAQPDEGAQLLMKAQPLAREFGLRAQEATAALGLGYIYQNRGDLLQAAAFWEEALRLTREEKDVTGYVEALASAGQAARADDNMKRAFELHEEAVRLAPTPVSQVRTKLDLGLDYFRTGDYPGAIARYREALAVDLHDPMHHVYSDGKLGLAQFLFEYEKGTPADLEESQRLIAEAMKTSVAVNDMRSVIYAIRIQAQLDVRLEKNEAALKGFDKVFAIAQEHRERSSSSEARSVLTYDEQLAFRGYLDLVFADAMKSGVGVFRTASPGELAGLRRLERARYESFGALRVGQLDAQTTARVDKLLGEMGQKSLAIAALEKTDRNTAQTTELHDLQTAMARLHAELDGIRTSAAAKQARAAKKTEAGMRDWRALAPGAAQLSYALGGKQVYAVIRSEAGTRVTVLSPSRKELEAQLAAFSKLDVQTKSREIEGALEQISSVLLPAGLLPEKTSAVEIVAEGRVASIPFPALRSPTNARQRLAETHVVSMITSLFDVDDSPRAPHARPYRFVALASGSGTYRAAVADPTPRLQAATKEIRVVADLFTARDSSAKIKLLIGADGNAPALRDLWGSGADVVHFATHALADLRQPIASLLVLPATDASGKATYLTAGQVQGWRGDVELVFLSACESAIGPPQYAAGMPGLQRAFLRAGARGVIATLAPIEDVLAQEFAADFYTRYTNGQSAPQALSDTQRAWLIPKTGHGADEQLRRRITALSHAYFAG